MSRRIEATGNEAYAGLTTDDDWTGVVRCLPERLDQPIRWRRPRRVFVNSMSDLFHPDVPIGFVWETMAVMGIASHHQFQVLTKRPQRMRQLLHGTVNFHSKTLNDKTRLNFDSPASNIWLGTSIESDEYAFRARHLAQTPAAVRFLSLEPLLGPLPSLALDQIDWVIVGGESGPVARPMHPDWVRDIRDRCVEAGVAFFFKQWGAWAPWGTVSNPKISSRRSQYESVRFQPDGTRYEAHKPDMFSLPGMESMIRVGKKAAGRNLDGRTWDEYPAAGALLGGMK